MSKQQFAKYVWFENFAKNCLEQQSAKFAKSLSGNSRCRKLSRTIIRKICKRGWLEWQFLKSCPGKQLAKLGEKFNLQEKCSQTINCKQVAPNCNLTNLKIVLIQTAICKKKVSCNDVICKSSKQRDLQTTTNPKKKVNEEFALFTSSF